MAASAVPFRYITGLPQVAQVEIERNFLHLQQAISGGINFFDCLVGADFANDPASHRYSSVSAAMSSECPVGDTKATLRIGMVVTYPTGIIFEPASAGVFTGTGLSGNLTEVSIFCLGAWRKGSGASSAILQGTAVWDVNGNALNTLMHWQFHGIYIRNTGAAVTNLCSNGTVFMSNSRVEGSDLSSLGTIGTVVFNGNLTCFNSVLVDVSTAGNNGVILIDTDMAMAVKDLTLNNDTYWDGGSVTAGVLGHQTLTFGGGKQWVRFTSTETSVYVTSTTVLLSVTGSVNTLIDATGATNQNFDLNIGAGSQSVIARGSWRDVTIAASSTTGVLRKLEGTVVRDVDITGPAHLDIAGSQSAPHHVTLRGTGIHGRLHLQNNDNPFLKLVDCDHALLEVEVKDTAISCQAYTIDAASTNNLIVLGGSHQANFSVASTDSGTNNRIITEISDSIVNSNNDDRRKDFILADLLGPMAGLNYFPAIAPGSAPTGPAGGALGGNYPNPIFAGRDASVDEMTKDILFNGLELPSSAGATYYPPNATTAVAVVDFNQVFMLMGG